MKLKKLLSAIIAGAMVLGTMSVSAFAATSELKAQLDAGTDVTLSGDTTLDETLAITKDVTLDLGGKTLKLISYDNKITGATLTVKNGKIDVSDAKELGVDSFFWLNTDGHLSFDSVDFYGDGYSSGYAVFHLVEPNSTLSFNKGSITLSNEIHTQGGFLKSENQSGAKATFTDTTISLTDVGLASVYLPVEIKDSTVTVTGAKMGNAFNRSALTVDNSTLTITGCGGRGITLENGDLVIKGNSSVTVSGCSEANIAVSNDKKITVDASSSLNAESIVTKDTVNDASSAVEAATGATVDVGAPVKISETSYATLSAALADAAEGATIKLEKGTYSINGNKISTKGITLEGSDGTVINASAPIEITAENVTLKNLKVDSMLDSSYNQGSVNAAAALIKVTGNNVAFDGVTFTGGGQATYGANVDSRVAKSTFTGCSFSGAFRGVQFFDLSESAAFTGCTFEPIAYTFNVNASTGGTVTVKDSTLKGWTSYSVDKVEFNNCKFEKGSNSSYNAVASYTDTSFTGCDFDSETFAAYDQNGEATWTASDCKVDGAAKDNSELASLFELYTRYTENVSSSSADDGSKATGFITKLGNTVNDTTATFDSIKWTVTSNGVSKESGVFNLNSITLAGGAELKVGLVVSGLDHDKAKAEAEAEVTFAKEAN